MKVITRFAPSPTGMLHIGSARTALFNYLYARHMGGEFRLRIEDTDTARNSDAAYQAILDGLKWLGLTIDGDVVYQSQRADRHREIAEELVKRGGAYYCYTTQAQLAEQRAAAEAKGEVFKYDRKWRPTAAGDTPPAPKDIKPSIRIKAPMEGDVFVRDAVQGDVRFGPDALDDLVILRSDGTPTYNLAVVVDDHDMGVTHIIRGDDHLNNAGRQTVIYQAMGWDVPTFAHIPLIHGADGAKLSKRHGATSTTEYAAMGYLPEAMRNYLARLGWGHGDDEIFSDAQAIEWFTLNHIGKAPSRLDFAKLNFVNAHYLREKPNVELVELLTPFLQSVTAEHSSTRRGEDGRGALSGTASVSLSPPPILPPTGGGMPITSAQQALLTRAMDGLKPRAHTLIELADAARFYLTAPTAYDEKAQATLTKNGANIALVLPLLEALPEPWQPDAVKAAMQEAATTHGKKIGEIMPPLRAAIVGTMSGPDIPEAMAILGKTEVIARLKAAMPK